MKTKIYIFILFCFSLSLKGFCTGNIDSLKAVYANARDATEKFNAAYQVTRALSSKRDPEARIYLEKCAETALQLNNPIVTAKVELMRAMVLANEGEGIEAEKAFKKFIPVLQALNMKYELAEAYGFRGMNSIALGDYYTSIENLEKGNEISKELKNDRQLCENYMYLGRAYENLGNNTKGLEYYQQALVLAQTLNDEKLISETTLFIGALYTDGINEAVGMKYLSQAAKTAERLKDTSMLINAYTFIANNYYYKHDYAAALKMYEKIKSFCRTHGSKNTYAGTLGNMGNVYADMGQLEKAMELQQEAARIFEEISDKQGLTICYSALGIDYLNLKEYDKALEYFNRSLPMAVEMQSLEDLIEIHQNLARLYEEKGEYQEAYRNFKLYKQFSDSVYNTNNSQRIAEMELNYQFENKQKETKLLQALTQERYKRTVIIAIGGAFILLTVVVLIARSSRQRKRANKQLTLSNTAIRMQKEELETHKKEITDSINYAKRIQESILPPDNYWKNILPDSFIFYRPKDIVSGDFYWIEQKNDSVCFAAVDCTGHGVPGALMSVVGFNLLTQAVNEMSLTVPSEILKHLDYGVTKTLRQSGDGKGVKDGMDLSLCSLNKNTNILQYAGAFNSLYYIKDGIFSEVKSDKFPIGVNLDGKVDNYTNHSIALEKGDCVYLFSDGYADQFGGPKGKKYKYNQLKELLHTISPLPMEVQKQKLADAFDLWKGELEQVDDVVIIGVRI